MPTETDVRACGTCRHWDGASHPNVDQRWGSCMFILGPQHDHSSGSERAGVDDASGYSASLNTRDDFACIEWQAQGE